MIILGHRKPYLSLGFKIYNKEVLKFSLLNTSNSSKAEEFSLKDIEVLKDSKKQPWFKRAHVGKCLELVYIHRSTAKREDEDQKTRVFLQAK